MQGDLHQDEKNKGFAFAASATIEHFAKGICKLTQKKIFVLVTLLICVNVYQWLNRAISSKEKYHNETLAEWSNFVLCPDRDLPSSKWLRPQIIFKNDF